MNTNDPQKNLDASSIVTTLTLPVDGMTCASCVARVEKTLKHLEGVENATVNLATEKATIRFHSSQVSLNALEEAVAKAKQLAAV